MNLQPTAAELEREKPPRQETPAKLALLENVTFDPPRQFGKKVYDDKEFCASLRKQVEGGRRLSIAQIAYLDKILRKYAKQIPDFDRQAEELGLSAEAPAAPEGQLDELLGLFDSVREWRPATTRKGRTWDDREFLQSLKTQYEQRRQLSFKQVGALKRLAAAYATQIPDYAGAKEKLGLSEPRVPRAKKPAGEAE